MRHPLGKIVDVPFASRPGLTIPLQIASFLNPPPNVMMAVTSNTTVVITTLPSRIFIVFSKKRIWCQFDTRDHTRQFDSWRMFTRTGLIPVGPDKAGVRRLIQFCE